MPIATPNRKQVSVTNANQGANPEGVRPLHWFLDVRGVPRFENFTKIRLLETTHTISIPLDLVKTQVATTPLVCRPTIEDPTDEHHEVCEDILDFFDGRYNSNFKSRDHLIKNWAHDIVSIDSGILELVPREDGWLGEIYNRDGAVFTKDPDRHDRLPEPPDPAYWQFGRTGSVGGIEVDIETGRTREPMRSIAERHGGFIYGSHLDRPIGFSRDQIVWSEMNPLPWTVYGRGKVQEAQRLAELILNQDSSNLSYFNKNEIPDGLLHILEANADEIDRFREKWNDEVRGQRHVLPMAGGKKMEFVSFRPTPEELEFLASQKWYNQLVWFVFGLNQAEIGDVESINRATIKELALDVWRQTTGPLLDTMANDLNSGVLPFIDRYWDVDGEVELAFEMDNPRIEELEREAQRSELEAGTRTINEIRVQERGEEPLPWGDIPNDLMRSVARSNPIWALEHWGDIPEDELPEPAADPLLGAYGVGERSGGNGSSDELPEVEAFEAAGIEIEESDPEDFSDAEEGSASPPDTYSLEWFDRALKEPMRNEPYVHQYPPLVSIAETLTGEVSSIIEDLEPDIEEIVEERFPEEEQENPSRPFIDLDLDDVMEEFVESLRDTVIERDKEAMEVSAEFHAERLEDELEEELEGVLDAHTKQGEEAILGTAFDIEDTFAMERLARVAGQRMVTVGASVRERVRATLLDVAEDGGNVSAATEALRENIDEISDSHARLVGRTEIMDAGRNGSQALAEASDMIQGKEWNSTGDPQDGRTRPWHAAMNGTIIEKDDLFHVPDGWEGEPHYQPADYPRRAFVVGEDQPFNCRCDQRPVLRDDMPEDLIELDAAFRSLRIAIVPESYSERQREIVLEHCEHPRESLESIIERHLEDRGIEAACERLGISTATIYDWGKELGIDRFV